MDKYFDLLEIVYEEQAYINAIIGYCGYFNEIDPACIIRLTEKLAETNKTLINTIDKI